MIQMPNHNDLLDNQVFINIVPNPASNLVTVNLSGIKAGSNAELTVFDNLGRNIWKQQVADGEQIIQLDLTNGNWHTGLYTVMVKSGGERAFQRLMVQQ